MSTSHAVFHPLRVAADRAADRRLGRAHLRRARRAAPTTTLRATASTSRSARADGDDVRRSYSICTPPSLRACSGSASSGCPAAPSPSASLDALRRRRRARRDDARPGGSPPTLDPAHRQALRRDRRRLGDHAGALDRGDASLEAEPRSPVTLVYANRTHRTVMFLEELARPQGPLPRPVPAASTCCPASRRRSSCSPAGSTRDRLSRILDALLPADDRRRVVPVRAVARWSSDLRKLLVEPTACRKKAIHAELFHVESGRRRVRRTPVETGDAEGAARDDQARRPDLDVRAARPTAWPCSTRRCGCAPTRRSPARAASAAPAAPRCVEGTVEMDTNYALEPEEVERGYVLTCQSHPTSRARRPRLRRLSRAA